MPPRDEIHELLGRMDGKLDSLGDRCADLSNGIERVRDQVVDIHTRVAVISSECPRHEKRISTVENAIRNVETTGSIHVTQQKATWKTLTIIGASLIGLASFLQFILRFIK